MLSEEHQRWILDILVTLRDNLDYSIFLHQLNMVSEDGEDLQLVAETVYSAFQCLADTGAIIYK